jgi:hypothetical protein
MFLTGTIALLGMLVFVLPLWSQEKQPAAGKLEARLLKALGEGKVAAIKAVSEDIQRLSEDQRRGLAFRVRPDAIEFRFVGHCPGHGRAEFLLSNKFREYESLLVLAPRELARAKKVWKAAQRAKATRPPALGFKLLWTEKGKARCEDLEDALRMIDPKERHGGYYQRLEWEDHGLRIPNVKFDPVTVPGSAQPAQMLLILRPAFYQGSQRSADRQEGKPRDRDWTSAPGEATSWTTAISRSGREPREWNWLRLHRTRLVCS